MVSIDFKLFAETDASGSLYSITVNENREHVRLVVSRTSANKVADEVYQGIDLTSDECLALGEYLISASKRIKAN